MKVWKISGFKKYGVLEENTNDHDIKLCVFDIETFDEKTRSTWINPYALGFYDGVFGDEGFSSIAEIMEC